MNRKIWIAVLAAALVTPAGAATLEEVVAKHIAAKGGKKNWQAVKSMKLSGTYTAFSEVSPFTLHRQRDRKYHIDHKQNGRTMIIGFDDERAWWDNHWLQPGATPIPEGPDMQWLTREVEFATPLFDYDSRGAEAELIGETEIEGFPAIGIKLTWPDETVDTWYLDPDSYLEIARESPGSDFGQPMPQRTFFDDFREIEGVKIPFLVESQWYTRDKVMQVEQAELNVAIDEALFRMPAPIGMESLVGLRGKWDVKVSTRQQPGAPWQESERSAEIEGVALGALLKEQATTPEGNEFLWTLSYDKYKDCYRYTEFNDSTGHLDVHEGRFDEQGKLVLSNVETGTPSKSFGMTLHIRLTIADVEEGSFRVEREISIDGGENWFLAGKQEFSRAAEGS